MMLKRVVFPAPFGPMIDLICPRITLKLKSEMAVRPPKVLLNRDVSKIGLSKVPFNPYSLDRAKL
jgi:hypothetical protein